MGPREIAGAFGGALACYVCWRWLAHLIAREAAVRRTMLRYWWPTAMLAWSWFMLWATSFPGSSRWLGFVRDPLSIAYFGVNLPQAVVGNGLLGVLIGAPEVVQGSVASAAVWLLWYAVIRVWQRRRESSQSATRIVP
ncbi:MAG: hypothetical protein ABI833_18140 [Acidobacteriota bacterium]